MYVARGREINFKARHTWEGGYLQRRGILYGRKGNFPSNFAKQGGLL